MDSPRKPDRTRFPFWTWTHRITALGFLMLLALGSQGWIPWIHGSPTAATWFQIVPFVDPLAAIELFLASGSTTATVLVGAGITLLTAVVLGRVFCGWLCPLGLILDLNGAVRERARRWLARRQIRLPTFRMAKALKYWLLACTLGLTLVASLPVFTMLSPINLVLLAIFVSPLPVMAGIGIIVMFEWFLPRAFCRSICPLGALYAVVGRCAVLRIRIRECGEQTMCRLCALRCPVGIDVLGDHVLAGKPSIDDVECTRCGSCTDVCAGRILHLGFGRRT